VSWDEFCKVCHRHHLPEGTMRCNLREFLDLQQGTNSVYEYIKKFNYLAEYGTHHVDTNDKKAEMFRRGLNLPFQYRLFWFRDMSFNSLVSAAIEQEGTYRALFVEEEEKRKMVVSRPSEDSTRGAYLLVYTQSAGKS
jgi:hypothetical protein